VKERLQEISSILQYLSFETMESMLYQMKSLNLKKLQTEFCMLTMFHAHEFTNKIDSLPVSDQVKESMLLQVEEFMTSLFELANFDPKAQNSTTMEQLRSKIREAKEYTVGTTATA